MLLLCYSRQRFLLSTYSGRVVYPDGHLAVISEALRIPARISPQGPVSGAG
jgi:hypothetical protein